MLITTRSISWASLAFVSLCADAMAAYVLDGADPSVVWVDGNAFSVQSRNGGVSIRAGGGTLESLGEAEPREVWKDKNSLGNIWAPEIVEDGERFYIYFSAGPGDGHRMYVISSDEPDTGYSDETELKLPDDRWAIDGTLFRYEGELWYVWSGWSGDANDEQNLYICRMRSPTEPTGARYVISQPREPWERVVGNPWINEGPEAIVDPDGQLHIVYSADGSWSESYCLGDLRLKKGGDPTNVWDWYKSNGCVMGSNPDQMMEGWDTTTKVNGPGHHTFAIPGGELDGLSTSNTDHPFMFHAVPKGTEYSWSNREWFSGSFRWVPDVRYSRANVPGDNENVGWSLMFSEESPSE
ncbi:hypothetical protein jhhlp_001743 [Lomentospora prolificans]|uniref:Beta-xylosidase C-terminal Concanavalin A-like domain-containing protein n=1 Tax=Lomentospora prolificans TaxID=41688 RepID=A0A2N3NH45_9PEZI|nr:hypothetical protein jhhlp_001743 [Lomentospora prolificans]